MRGTEYVAPDQQRDMRRRLELTWPCQNRNGRRTPSPEVFPDAISELDHMVNEMKKFANVRNTHRRIEHIATRLAEILPDIYVKRSDTSSSPDERAGIRTEAHEILRRHESIMAELLRESGAQDENSLGKTRGNIDASNICSLIVELVGHWDAVKAELGRIDDPALPRNTPRSVVTPSSPVPSLLDTNSRLDLETRLKIQDQTIDEMYSILKTFEHRFANTLGGHTDAADSNSENNNRGAQSSVGNNSRKNKNRKNRKNTTGRGTHVSSDNTNSSPIANNSGRRPNLYKAIYSTPTTIASPISQHAAPGQSPSSLFPLPEDFPPLPSSGRQTTPPKPRDDNGGRLPAVTHPPVVDKRAQKPAPKKVKPPALLVKGIKPYPETIKAIKDRMDPRS